ncbi:unnamed protein product, partial [Porites lobata]
MIITDKWYEQEITDKWYEHEPETVIHNKDNNITIMWDMPVNTDRTITANRPDIIYKDLELEIQRMWHMKTVVIPV